MTRARWVTIVLLLEAIYEQSNAAFAGHMILANGCLIAAVFWSLYGIMQEDPK